MHIIILTVPVYAHSEIINFLFKKSLIITKKIKMGENIDIEFITVEESANSY